MSKSKSASLARKMARKSKRDFQAFMFAAEVDVSMLGKRGKR